MKRKRKIKVIATVINVEQIKKRDDEIRAIKKRQRQLRKNAVSKILNKKAVMNLEDSYIKNLLSQEYKLKAAEIPTELIELRRTMVKIRRKKKQLAEYAKICQHHGPLREHQINQYVERGKIRRRCKQCQKIAHRNHTIKHNAKIREKHAVYRAENKEKVAAIKSKSRRKHREKHRDAYNKEKREDYWKNHKERREKENIRKARNRENLSDGYVKQVFIKRKFGMRQKDVPHDIVETMRAYIKLKRKVREIKKEIIPSKVKIHKGKYQWLK